MDAPTASPTIQCRFVLFWNMLSIPRTKMTGEEPRHAPATRQAPRTQVFLRGIRPGPGWPWSRQAPVHFRRAPLPSGTFVTVHVPTRTGCVSQGRADDAPPGRGTT
ncbi:hypothetical protein KH5H1_25700 [Corallococcus caeni]|nr:hypothetical protein KH5H1_25700 [Corallococcus sp. KH5-1]